MKMKLEPCLQITVALVSAATPFFPDPVGVGLVVAALRIVIAINSIMTTNRCHKV